MGVVNAYEAWSKRTFEAVAGGARATRAWTVLLESPSDLPELCVGEDAQAKGVPKRTDLYATGSMLKADKISAPRAIGPTLYEVLVEYTSVTPVAAFDNPLLEPIQVKWGAKKYTVPIDTDLGPLGAGPAKPIVNPAGEPFDVKRQRSDQQLIVVRNEGAFNAAYARAFYDKRNAETFLGCAIGQVLCEDITGESMFKYGIYYWRVTYQFLISETGHVHQEQSVGTRYIETVNNQKRYRNFEDGHGRGLNGKGWLDSDGSKWTGHLNATPTYPNKLNFTLYPMIPFSPLGIA